MSLVDRLLFWTVVKRGYTVPEPAGPDEQPADATGAAAGGADGGDDRELLEEVALFRRKVAHIDAMAESFGLRVPARGEQQHVDL